MLETLNYYIIYGKDMFEGSTENLRVLFEMATLSLYKKDSPIMLSYNTEGALLLSIMLQNLDGPLVKQASVDILTNVQARLQDQPMSKTF